MTVIDEHAGQLIPDGAMDQRRRHGRVDATRQPQDDFLIADLGPDLLHRLGDVVAHDPIRPGPADVEDEPLEDRLALLGVGDFGMELHRVEVPRLVGHAGDRAAFRRSHQAEAGRELGHLVAVAHPDVEHPEAFVGREVGDAVQQLGMATSTHRGETELALMSTLHLATELVGHGLHAIADPQHRHAQFEHRLGRLVGRFLVDAGMAARQDHTLERAIAGVVPDPLVGDVTGMDFAQYMGLAHASRDQLGDLGTEIEDEDFLMHQWNHRDAPGLP
jgi:hypothetical protein